MRVVGEPIFIRYNALGDRRPYETRSFAPTNSVMKICMFLSNPISHDGREWPDDPRGRILKHVEFRVCAGLSCR